jgi:hypothetical protein
MFNKILYISIQLKCYRLIKKRREHKYVFSGVDDKYCSYFIDLSTNL